MATLYCFAVKKDLINNTCKFTQAPIIVASLFLSLVDQTADSSRSYRCEESLLTQIFPLISARLLSRQSNR